MPRPLDEEVFAKDGFRCVYCGFDGGSFDGWVFLAVDHFRPKSRGGTDDIANLVTACSTLQACQDASVRLMQHAGREGAVVVNVICTCRYEVRQDDVRGRPVTSDP